MIRLLNLRSPRGWAVLAVALLASTVLLALLGWCDAREDRRGAHGDRDLARGRTVSAVEAITEIGKLEDRGRATDDQVEEAHGAIRQADPADRDRVARYHLCVLQQRPDCDGLL